MTAEDKLWLTVYVLMGTNFVWWFVCGYWERQCQQARQAYRNLSRDVKAITETALAEPQIKADMPMEEFKEWKASETRKKMPGYPTRGKCPKCEGQMFGALQFSTGVEKYGRVYFCRNCPYEEVVK